MTPAWKVAYSDIIGGAYRSFHECKEEHWLLTHADWWTDVVSGKVAERVQIFDPSKGDGGSTWSGGHCPSTASFERPCGRRVARGRRGSLARRAGVGADGRVFQWPLAFTSPVGLT